MCRVGKWRKGFLPRGLWWTIGNGKGELYHSITNTRLPFFQHPEIYKLIWSFNFQRYWLEKLKKVYYKDTTSILFIIFPSIVTNYLRVFYSLTCNVSITRIICIESSSHFCVKFDVTELQGKLPQGYQFNYICVFRAIKL